MLITLRNKYLTFLKYHRSVLMSTYFNLLMFMSIYEIQICVYECVCLPAWKIEVQQSDSQRRKTCSFHPTGSEDRIAVCNVLFCYTYYTNNSEEEKRSKKCETIDKKYIYK